MTSQTELQDLRTRLLELKRDKKNEAEEKYLRQEIETLEYELRQQSYQKEKISSGGIRGAWFSLKAWLIETKSWLSFKLIVMGISIYYGGAYTNYQDYGFYLKISGLALVGLGIYKLPLTKQLWEWIDK